MRKRKKREKKENGKKDKWNGIGLNIKKLRRKEVIVSIEQT